MDTSPILHRYILAFFFAGLIAIVGFASGDIAFGIIGLGILALLGGRLATKLASR
jgi:hypothetical protein